MHNMSLLFYKQFSQKTFKTEELTDISRLNLLIYGYNVCDYGTVYASRKEGFCVCDR